MGLYLDHHRLFTSNTLPFLVTWTEEAKMKPIGIRGRFFGAPSSSPPSVFLFFLFVSSFPCLFSSLFLKVTRTWRCVAHGLVGKVSQSQSKPKSPKQRTSVQICVSCMMSSSN